MKRGAETRVKVVGRRQPPPCGDPDRFDEFVALGVALRGSPDLLSKGVYRLRTFEEAERWNIQETMDPLFPNSLDR